MKFKFLLPLLGVAVAVSFSSCSQHKNAGGDTETAEQIANGTMPPWIAEGSGGYETGSYQSAGSSRNSGAHAYNPPAKPSVRKSSSKSSRKSSVSKRSSKSSKSAKSSKSSKSKNYSVRKGDTLGAIAKRQGVSVSALKKANGLRSDMIHIGQNLKVPKK